jgi:hypothetical protein
MNLLLDATTFPRGNRFPDRPVSAGRWCQCIATRPRPPQLLAPCHPTLHGARPGAGEVKKCSPKAARLWPIPSRFWPILAWKRAENGRIRQRFRALTAQLVPSGTSLAQETRNVPASGPKTG